MLIACLHFRRPAELSCSCRWPLGREYLRLMRLQKEANLTGYRNAWCSSSLEQLGARCGQLGKRRAVLGQGSKAPELHGSIRPRKVMKSLIEG